jgi:hypothetical protein
MGQLTGTNDYLTRRKPMPTSSEAAETLSVRFALAMATGDLDVGDIGPIGILPAGHVPVDMFVDGTDMDTGAAALIVQFGLGNLALQDAAGAVSADAKNTLVSTVAKDGGAAWGSTTASNTSFMQQVIGYPMTQVQAVDYDRYIVAKITTAPTAAAAGTLGLTLNYRAA